jgi:hypothetical protein
MTDPPSRRPDVKAVWQSQAQEISPMALEKVRADALKFRRRTQIATVREMIAAVVVIVIFGLYLRFLPGALIRIGSVVTIVWALFYMWNYRRLITAGPVPADGAQCVDFYRGQLERRRDVARNSWRWTLAPLAPVMVLFMVGRWIGPTPPGRTLLVDHAIIVASTVLMIETIALMWLWVLHRADKFQDRIDELDALRRSGS